MDPQDSLHTRNNSGSETLEQTTQKYAQILQLGQIIASEVDIDLLLHELISRTNTIVNAERSTLFLHDPQTNQLSSLVGTGLHTEEIRVSSDQGVIGWVFQNRKPLTIQDAYRDFRFFPGIDRHLHFQTKNIICAPLINRSHVCIGVLEALNKKTGDFSGDDIQFLTHISHFATLIIDYIHSYQEHEFLRMAKERITKHLVHEIKTPKIIVNSVIEFISKELQPKYRDWENLSDTPPIPPIFSMILSGGQTGTDQGALDAALELNHPCGGWCPKGRCSEDKRIPARYPVQVHSSSGYLSLIKTCLKQSDGALIFTSGNPTGGTKLTIDLFRKNEKPVFIVDLQSDPAHEIPEQIFHWGLEKRVHTLNVAGPKERKHPGTQEKVKAIVLEILKLMRTKAGSVRNPKVPGSQFTVHG